MSELQIYWVVFILLGSLGLLTVKWEETPIQIQLLISLISSAIITLFIAFIVFIFRLLG